MVLKDVDCEVTATADAEPTAPKVSWPQAILVMFTLSVAEPVNVIVVAAAAVVASSVKVLAFCPKAEPLMASAIRQIAVISILFIVSSVK